MKDKSYRLPTHAATPMASGYQSEFDVTELLDVETAKHY
jgi:hypothetical protein